MAIYEKPSDALAAIPKGATFRVRQSTNGRPMDVVRPDTGGKEWDADTFTKALANGDIQQKEKYILRPVIGGKLTSRRISLDLSLSEESTTVESAQPSGEAIQQAVGMAYVQAEVVTALTTWAHTDRERMYDLEEKLEEKDAEILSLKMRVKKLKYKLKSEADTDSISATLNKSAVEFMKGSGPLILAHKWSGGDPSALMQMLAAAVQAGAVKGG